ncbi:MAG TPA: hypothetical protein VJH03_01640 [Blastocatellia bacterium]|nr:hypothetical protein [Blastocatellia bacterium]
MVGKNNSRENGSTLVQAAITVAIIGVVVAFATPKIASGLREHRLSIASRQVADLIQRAKTQAISDNRTSSIVVDTAGQRMGLAVYDDAGAVSRIDYVPLPSDITFALPPNVSAPLAGAPTAKAVSFPAYDNSTVVFKQDFTSRGFPSVAAPGTINAVYLSNGRSYRGVTMSGVGGLRVWTWEDTKWVPITK